MLTGTDGNGKMAADTKENGDNVKEIATIQTKSIIKKWGNNICPDVVLSQERVGHIQDRHPGAYEQYGEHVPNTIENPDYIFNDVKNVRTAMFVRHVEETNLNVIVKLVLKDNDEQIQSSVITMYPMSDKRLRRMIKKREFGLQIGENVI